MALTRRHGAWAIIASRIVPVVRTLVAAAAGASHMNYGWFLAASVTGSALWAAAWIGAGDVLGGAAGRVVGAVPALVVLGVVVLVIRRVRRSRSARR